MVKLCDVAPAAIVTDGGTLACGETAREGDERGQSLAPASAAR